MLLHLSVAGLVTQARCASQEVTYRCRSCRRLLATAANSMPLDDTGKLADDGSSLFVEPMRYMEDAVLGCMAGKLYCPQCAPQAS